MADRCCSLCGTFYTDKTGHDYNICVSRCYEQLNRAKGGAHTAIDHLTSAYDHYIEATHILKQDWWKRDKGDK